MAKKTINFKLDEEQAERLAKAAEKLKCTKTEILAGGLDLQILWRKTYNELKMPQTLKYDPAKGFWEAEPEYRKKFLKKFIAAVERKIPVPYTVKGK